MTDLFDNVPEPSTTSKKICLACGADAPRNRIVCDACRADPDRAMSAVADDVARLEDAWKAAQRTASDATQARFAKVLEAHSEAYEPGPQNKEKALRIAFFLDRIKATLRKGDELSVVVAAWKAWDKRRNDLRILAVAAVLGAGDRV